MSSGEFITMGTSVKTGAGHRPQKYDKGSGKYATEAKPIKMKAGPITAGSGVVGDLVLGWVHVEADGTVTLEELACYDASCAPPSAGGTGGSKPGGKRGAAAAKGDDVAAGGVHGPAFKPHSDADLELLFPGRRGDTGANKVVHPDGTMSVEGLDVNGKPVKFSADVERDTAAQWDAIGNPKEAYVDNFVVAGKLAMGIDPKTGKIDAEQAARGTFDSKWYTVAHSDVAKISKDTGFSEDHVTAATTVLSAGRLWSGVANGNIETARRLAHMVKDNQELEIEQRHLDMMKYRHDKSEKGEGGRLGLNGDGALKPGKVKLSDLDSATAVEVMYAMNAMRGQKDFDSWWASSKEGTKTPKEHNKKNPPLFPLFTSKGTSQVKQALSVLRGEVTPREAISGPKYSSFYSNIRRPDKDYSSTNDTWHYRIMAGNLKVTHTKPKSGETRTDTIDRISMAKRSPDGKMFATTQDIFQAGPASKKDGITSGDSMFRDTTILTRQALVKLAKEHPDQFGTMKPHEFQALIWVHYGGGKVKAKDREKAWDGARDAMREVGL